LVGGEAHVGENNSARSLSQNATVR
jgi:hypothetical protein